MLCSCLLSEMGVNLLFTLLMLFSFLLFLVLLLSLMLFVAHIKIVLNVADLPLKSCVISFNSLFVTQWCVVWDFDASIRMRRFMAASFEIENTKSTWKTNDIFQMLNTVIVSHLYHYPRSCIPSIENHSIIEIIKNSLKTFFRGNKRMGKRNADLSGAMSYSSIASHLTHEFDDQNWCAGNYKDNRGFSWFNSMAVPLVRFYFSSSFISIGILMFASGRADELTALHIKRKTVPCQRKQEIT